MWRPYGAQDFFGVCTQPLRAGLRSVAPPALGKRDEGVREMKRKRDDHIARGWALCVAAVPVKHMAESRRSTPEA